MNYEERENAPMSCADVGYCEYGQTQCLGDMGGWYGDELPTKGEETPEEPHDVSE